MDCLFLDRFDAQGLKLLVEDLAQVHDHRFMDLLPQVRPEDLYERDLEGWDLAMQENARKIKLNLEADVDVGPVDRRRPPQGEATVGDLVETGPLGIRQLFELH